MRDNRFGNIGSRPLYTIIGFYLMLFPWLYGATLFVSPTGNNTPPYDTLAKAATSIQTAINFSIAGDTILVADGLYNTGFTTVNSSQNRIAINKAVTVKSINGPANAIIEGDQMLSIRGAYVGNGAVLDGFTIRNGQTPFSGSPELDMAGGCVWQQSNGLTRNSVISGGKSVLSGGGGNGGRFINCEILDNQSLFGEGGGIARARVEFSTIYSNVANSVGGGVTECVVINSAIYENHGKQKGGGLANFSVATNCTVFKNLAGDTFAGQGGGAYQSTLVDCEVYENTTTGNGASGGGMALSTAIRCKIYRNTSYHAGGMEQGHAENCLIYDNNATVGDGGGCRQTTLEHCTVAYNSVDSVLGKGGGVFDSTDIKYSIIYFNTTGSGSTPNVAGSTITYSCATPTPAGTGNIGANPLFTSGLTFDFTLQSGSPCIDTAAPSTTMDDFNKYVRPVGVAEDMGAHEAGGTNPNQPPVATADTVSTNEDHVVIIDVLANDSDPDGDPISILSVGSPSHGSASIVNGKIEYSPNLHFNGTDFFSYTISDSGGEVDTDVVSVTMLPIQDVPEAIPDHATTLEDTDVIIDIVDNDLEVDGDPIMIVSLSTPSTGSVMIVSNKAKYTPPADFVGTATFTNTITDGFMNYDSTLVTVTMSPVNDAPVGSNDVEVIDEDVVSLLDVLANDTDVDGDFLFINGIIQQPTNGSATIELSDTRIEYTPNTHFFGTDQILYELRDGFGGFSTATVSIVINPVNDAPVAVPDTTNTMEDVTVLVDVLKNDSDIEMDPIEITMVGSPTTGSVQVTSNMVLYTPSPDFSGIVTFSYSISDGLLTNSTMVTVEVYAVNDAPWAVPDTTNTMEDVAVLIDVLKNDSDIEMDPIEITMVGSPTTGSVQVTSNMVLYTPSPGFSGIVTFSYSISDGLLTNSTMVTVEVYAVNNAPVAVDDHYVTFSNALVVMAVTVNDIELDNETLSICGTSMPSNGALNVDGLYIEYTPNAGWVGDDIFTYVICDEVGNSSTGTVFVETLECFVDFDEDGMSDAWETNHFGSTMSLPDDDSDMDGTSNLEEFIADTDPNDASSLFEIINYDRLTPQQISIMTSTLRQYHFHRSESLSSNHWIALESNIPGNGGIMMFLDNSTNEVERVFYRVEVMHPCAE